MRVLITGVDGFVGSHMAEFVSEIPNAELFGTTLGPKPGPNLGPLKRRIRTFQADILNSGRVEELLITIRPDRIIHLAAQAYVPASVVDPRGTLQTNINGSLSVLESVRRVREREGTEITALIVSSSEVYGRVDPSVQPITEDFRLVPGNPYAASKAGIDLIAQAYRRTYDLPVIIARPFNHAGPRQSPNFVCSEFGRKFADIVLGHTPPVLRTGNLASQRDFTDVRDVVRAYWMMLEEKSDEFVYNVCSGVPRRISDIVDMYEEVTGITVEVMEQESKSRHYDIPLLLGSNARLRAATGWAPSIPLSQTLRDTFLYWKSNPEPA